jgi:DNA-binding XRE family transcriptional regulator
MLTLRTKIKALREANKLTQVEAAKFVDMRETSYANMERGKGVCESKKIKEVYDKLQSLLDASNLHT